MAIRDVYKQIEADREEEEWKSMGIDLLKGLAETEMGKKVAAFQQREGVQKSNINYKTAVKNGGHIVGERDEAYGNANGVIDFYVKKFTPIVQDTIAMKYKEETFDPDRYEELVYKESLRLAREQKEKLDKAYSAAINLRGSESYDSFVKVNDGYNETLGGALGARIRRGFTGESRESLDSKAEEAIKNSSYARNAEAVNSALQAYNDGFTMGEAYKIGNAQAIEDLKRTEETITSIEELEVQNIPTGRGSNIILRTQKVTYTDINGVTGSRTEGMDFQSREWLEKGISYDIVETEVVNDSGVTVKVKGAQGFNRLGKPVGPPIALGTPDSHLPDEDSDFYVHVNGVLNSGNKIKDGEFASARLSIQQAMAGTMSTLDGTKRLTDIKYQEILAVHGYNIDPRDVATQEKREALDNTLGLVAGLSRQIHADFFDKDASKKGLSTQLAAQIFINFTNNILTESKGQGTLSGVGVGKYYFDYGKGAIRLNDVGMLNLLDAYGTREGGPHALAEMTGSDYKKMLANKKHNYIREFQKLDVEKQLYYMQKFADSNKFEFVHHPYPNGRSMWRDFINVADPKTLDRLKRLGIIK